MNSFLEILSHFTSCSLILRPSEDNRELFELTETQNEVLKATFEREKKSFVEELNRLTVKIEELSI